MTADDGVDVPEIRLRDEDAASGILSADEPLDLSDLLNTVLDRGAVVHGEVTIAVADVDLIKLNLGLLLQAVATAEQRSRARENAGRGSAASLSGAMGSIPRAREPVPAVGLPGPEGGTMDGEAPDSVRPGRSDPSNSLDAIPPGGQDAYSREPERRAESSLNDVARGLPARINADAAGPEAGLARLVLTLIEVLRKVLEHQAVRRMEGGRLSGEEIERLGLALAKLNDRMGELKRVFGLSDDDLEIDLGPLGRLK